MKLKNLFFALATAVCVATAPAMAQESAETDNAGPLTLTLEQALEIALSENPTVKIADQTIEAKKYAKRGTYASLWPEISASATYQRYIKKQTMHIMDQSMKVGTSNNYSGGFSASIPVVNAQLWKSLKISAMDVELAVEQARGSRIDMVEQVSKAFYQVLLAKDSYNVYKRVYDNAVENHKIVEKKVRRGHRFGVRLHPLEGHGVECRARRAECRELDRRGVVAAEGVARIGSGDRYRLRGHAGRLRGDDERAVRRRVRSGEQQHHEAVGYSGASAGEDHPSCVRAANLPTLSLSAAYNFTAMEETFKFGQYTWNPYSYAALSLNIPIFAGGKRRADVKQAKINLNTLQLQRENTERQLRTAIMQYISSMQTNLKQYNASAENISQAKRGYEIAVKRYDVGGGTLVDVDNSQLAYTQAELTRSTAIYNYLVNHVSLEKIYGIHTYTEN